MPIFWLNLDDPISGWWVNPEIGYSYPRLAPGKSAPLFPIDWSAILGDRGEVLANPPPLRATPFCPLIVARGSAILAHFSQSDIGMAMSPEIGQYYPILWSGMWGPLIPGVWPGILDYTWGIAAKPPRIRSTLSSCPLISDEDAEIFAHFSHRDIVIEMDPELGYSYPRLESVKRRPLIRND